jgi:hypothetical protein
MLDDLELPQVQELTTYDRRTISELKPPGMAGSLLQNLGRRPLRIVLWGVAIGPGAQETVQKLDRKFRAAKPVPFTGDIVADARLDLVLIEDLRLQELAGKPQRYSYILTLREYIKPVAPGHETESGVDTDIHGDALNRVNSIADGADLVQNFAAGLASFVTRFSELLRQMQTIPASAPSS